MEKMSLEFECEKKLQNMQARNEQEAQTIVMVERTKVMDQIYMKHDVRFIDILHAQKKHGLENIEDDEELKTMQDANKARRQNMQKEKKQAARDALKLDPDQLAGVEEACNAAGEINTEPNMEGILNWEDFMKVFQVIVKLQIKTAVEIQNKHKDARREALGAGDKQKFAQACSEMMK